jgi:hypothetical protein
MNSWWQLGEAYGIRGSDLALYKIRCPFCGECGNFAVASHFEKKKARGSKRLNFDTLECGNCKGYVMVLWSASETGGLHNFEALPWPLDFDEYPEHWPESVGRYWMQAQANLAAENWDATVVMARSALQVALRDKHAQGRSLHHEIEDLAAKGLLPPLMKEWSHNLRELGNDSAHPQPTQSPAHPSDVQDLIQFLDFLLEYLYNLPHKIAEYRNRRNHED